MPCQRSPLFYVNSDFVFGEGDRPACNCWFSHDVTKIQTKKLLILPRFYFHDA